ncbi:hypothetical protein [uncultured Bacteroides sp.]|uniref:hypothetical protein n=1 Tax=uncultured Bacteroides sp. TaxID=162156 RepID=UPI0026238C8D|nr:hypothetical protein [uncultured Bacteroides sp.]
MKKKYLSALLFGALITASTGTFTSCKDYDDDINNLQEQVDKLAGLPTTEAMNKAIDAAKDAIQTEINGLKARLDAIEGSDQSEDISSLQNRIKALEDKLADYENLKQRISSLEAIDHDQYLTAEDVRDFVGQAEINEAVDALYKNDNGTYSGKIVDYIKTVLAAETVSKTDFEDLETAWTTFVEGSDNGTTLKSVVSRLEALELYADAIDDAVEKGEEYDSFADILAQIEQNKKDIAALAIPTSEGIVDLIKSELDKQDGIFKGIQDKLKDLGIDVESLKNMIQSIVFVPVYGTNEINISTLNAKVSDGENESWTPLESTNTRKLTFRVSPSTAAEKIAENYNIGLYSQKVETRSSDAIEVVNSKSLGNGLVEVEIAANVQVDKYAVCLHVTPKTEVEDNADKNTDITSDYFIVNTGSLYLQDISLTAPDGSDKLNVVDGKVTAIDFNKSEISLSVSEDKGGISPETKTLSELGLTEDMLNIEYSIDAENQYFSMTEGVLSIKDGQVAAANAGQKITVASTINFKEAVENQVSYENGNLSEACIYWTANIDCGEYSIPFNQKADTRTPLAEGLVDDIKANLNITENLDNTNAEYNHGMLDVRFTTLLPQIFVEAGTTTAPNDGTIKGEITTTAGYNKVNLTANVEITMDIDAAKRETTQWRDNNIFIPFESNQLKYTDLTQIFSNYLDIEEQVTEMGGMLKFVSIVPETADGSLVSISGSTLTIDPSKYKGETIGVKLQAEFGSNAIYIEASEANIKIFETNNLSGELNTDAEVGLTFEKPEGGESTAKDAYSDSWAWKVGENDVKSSLSQYGLSTKVVLEGEAKEWLTVTNNGSFDAQINVKSEKWNMTTLLEDKTFNVTIKFNTPWENISESESAWTEKTATITVTIKKWNENSNI